MVDWGDAETTTAGPPRRDPWDDYAAEKVTDVLLVIEMRQEDRNGYFTWTWVWGIIVFGTGIFQAWSNSAAGKVDWWPLVSIPAGIAIVIIGITLRVGGGLELGRVRRLQKLVGKGIFPRP